MRIVAPVGRGPVFVQGGCLLTPVMLLVYVVYWGVVLTIMTVVVMALAAYYAGWGIYMGVRWLCRQRWREPMYEDPAKYSNRR